MAKMVAVKLKKTGRKYQTRLVFEKRGSTVVVYSEAFEGMSRARRRMGAISTTTAEQLGNWLGD